MIAVVLSLLLLLLLAGDDASAFSISRVGRHKHQHAPSSPSALHSSVLDDIDSFYQSFPFASAFITCGIKASAADMVAQKNEIGSNSGDDVLYHGDTTTTTPTASNLAAAVSATRQQIDARRNLSFIMYGGLYQGIAQLIIYNQIFPLVFGDGTDVTTVLSKVAFDNAFISPLLCLPVAYLVKSLVFQFSFEEAKSRYFHDVREGLILKYWCFWIPAQSLTFSVIPVHLRIAFVAAVSFFWLVVFSSISSSSKDDST